MTMIALPILLIGAVVAVGIVIGVVAVVIYAAREQRGEK
jgi:hypothetical protein